MNQVLERNLEALIGQAYQPVRPRAEFRAALLGQLRVRLQPPQRIERFGAGRGAGPTRRWRPVVAIAAAVLIAVPLITLAALEFVRDSGSGSMRRLPGPVEGSGVAEGSGTAIDGTDAAGAELDESGRKPLDAERLEVPDSLAYGPEGAVDDTTGVLAGRVVDASSGQPIASFVFWRRLERDLPETTTPLRFAVEDEQGRFLFESLAPDRYALFVEAPGYAVWKMRGAEVEGGTESRHEVRLVRGSAVHGHVLDAATGAPLAGARVFAEFDLPQQVLDFAGRDLTHAPAASTLTDANGAYTLEHLSPGQHQLRVSHTDHATVWSSNFELPEGELERPLELDHVMLDMGGRLVGRVEHPDGTPWQGVQVLSVLVAMERPQPVMAYNFAITDVQGHYEIERLPEGYYVAMQQGSSPGGFHTESNLRQTSVRRGVTTILDFVPQVGGSELTGVLLDTREKPLVGYMVYLNPDPLGSAFQNWIATPVRADGRFRFQGVAEGSYDLYVAEDADQMIWLRRLDVAGTDDLQVELTLPEGSVSGVVRKADEVPTSALVMLMRWDDQESSWAFHGKDDAGLDGHYSFVGLGPGRYRLSAIGLTPSAGSANPSSFELGQGTQRQDVSLEPGGSLTLEVVDEAGEPVSGAQVRLFDESGQELAYHAEGTTDGAGHQRVLSLAEGVWTVTFSREGMPKHTSTIQVLAGEDNHLHVTLRR